VKLCDVHSAALRILPERKKILKRNKVVNERKCFLLFVKVLMRLLTKDKDVDPFLCQRAKVLIYTCNKRHQMGDPSFSQMQDMLEVMLRDLVGHKIWQKAQSCTLLYMMNSSDVA
jgi:hypothetical protein